MQADAEPPFLGAYPALADGSRPVKAAAGIHPIERCIDKAPSRRSMDFERALWLSCNKPAPSPSGARQVERNGPISGQTDDIAEREQGRLFAPRFDASGLITAIAQDAISGMVLMVAFMDREALDATIATGEAHFHSRSRGRLWRKGETSGHVLKVETILVDCDQDALLLKVRAAGPACHTNAVSCFYRALDRHGLTRIAD